MRPIVFTITGVGSQIVPLDWYANPPNVEITCVVGTGTPTYEIDATLDNVYDPTVTPNWSVITAPLASGAQGNKAVTITTPLRAIRCNVTVSATTVTFTIIQAGGGTQ